MLLDVDPRLFPEHLNLISVSHGVVDIAVWREGVRTFEIGLPIDGAGDAAFSGVICVAGRLAREFGPGSRVDQRKLNWRAQPGFHACDLVDQVRSPGDPHSERCRFRRRIALGFDPILRRFPGPESAVEHSNILDPHVTQHDG